MAAQFATRYSYEALAEDFYFVQQRDSINRESRRGTDSVAARKRRFRSRGEPSGFFLLGETLLCKAETIAKTEPPGKEWIIERRDESVFSFRLLEVNRIVPNPQMVTIKVPNRISRVAENDARSDAERLLAVLRGSRLLSIFLAVEANSLKSPFRRSIPGIGRIEIDEVYVALDKHGRQYVLPVQARGGADRLSPEVSRRHTLLCAQCFPDLRCRPIATQFIEEDVIALLELGRSGEEIKIVEERHYRLMPSDEITRADLQAYNAR